MDLDDPTWSSGDILEALLSKIDIRIYSLKFRKFCLENSSFAEKIFYEAVIRSTGVSKFKYEEFERKSLGELVNNKNSVTTQYPPIMRKAFQKNFNKFLTFIFADEKGDILVSFPNLTDIVQIFSNSLWDSMRLMATFVGIKYISGLFNLNLDTHPSRFKLKSDMSRLKSYVISNSIGDLPECVNEVIVREFMMWSQQYASWMITSTMLDEVIKLLDFNSEKVRCFAFDTVRRLVKTNNLDQLKTVNKNKIEKAILKCFGIENLFIFQTAIEILHNIVSHYGCLETAEIEELEKILLCLSVNDKKVERKGCIIVIQTLKKKLNFDDFWHFFSVRLEPSEINKLFNWYFLEEIEFQVFDRNSTIFHQIVDNEEFFCDGLKSLKEALIANEEVKFWFQIMGTLDTATNILALRRICKKVPQFDEQTVKNVWAALERAFFEVEDAQLCDACYEMIASMVEHHPDMVYEKNLSLVTKTLEEFMAGTVNMRNTVQLMAISKSSLVQDDNFCEQCYEFLNEYGRDYSEYCEKVFYIMCYLFERTLAIHRDIESRLVDICDFEDDDTFCNAIAELQVEAFDRVGWLESFFLPALKSSSNTILRFRACFYFVDIFRFFGPHIWNDILRFGATYVFDDDFNEKLALSMVVMPCDQGMCCITIKNFINLLSAELVDLEYLKFFLLYLDNDTHLEIVLDVIIDYSTVEEKIKNVAIIVENVLWDFVALDETSKPMELVKFMVNNCKNYNILHLILSYVKRMMDRRYKYSGIFVPELSNLIERSINTVQTILF